MIIRKAFCLPSFLRAVLMGTLLSGGAVFAQSDGEDKREKTPLEFQGSFRTRLEAWDWFGEGNNSRYNFSGNLLRLSVGQRGSHVDWKVEMAAPLLLRLPDDAQLPGDRGVMGAGGNYFAGNQRNRDAAMIFPKQVYVHLRHLGASKRHGLRMGRFEFTDGAEAVPDNATLAALKRSRVQQRILGPFGWTHVGRSFDGLHYTYDLKGANVTVVSAVPTRGVFQVDGWGWNKVAFTYGAYTRQLSHRSGASEFRLMSVYYTDWRDVTKTDNRLASIRVLDRERIQIGSYGGHFLHAANSAVGTFDLMLWGLVQSGSWGAQGHRAGAIASELGWQPNGLPYWKPWLRAGYFRSTGDNRPNDGTHTTFFQMMPTPRPYARIPFFNLMNNEDIHAGSLFRPHARMTINAEAHQLNLSARNDLWYQGGGVFQPWTFGYVGRQSYGNRGLANLYDINVDVKATKNLSLSAYFGYIKGRGVVRAIYPDQPNGSFGYLEATVRF